MTSNLSDSINRKISIISFIMKFAEENKISYIQAKKIYEKRYTENYQTIMNLASNYRVPYDLILSLIIDDGLQYQDIKWYTIYQKIYNDYLTDNKDLQLIKDYTGFVAGIIRELAKSVTYKSIPEIIIRMQRKIEAYAKKNKVSTAVAVLSLYYTKDLSQAKKIETFLSYNEKNNIESSYNIDEDFVSYLQKSTELKRETVHGITVVSPTEEGLKRLINAVNKVFLYGKEEYIVQLEQQSKAKNLILTDRHYKEEGNGAFYNNKNIIYISPSIREIELVDVILHESSHFLDKQAGQRGYYYSEIEQDVRAIFEEIRETINSQPYETLINNKNIPTFMRELIIEHSNKNNKGIIKKGKDFKKKAYDLANKYANNKFFVEKWKKEIEEEYEPETEEEALEFLIQKQLYEKDKYIRLIAYIYDIYDGLVVGILHDKYKTSGHGKEYYKIKGMDVIEMIAEIGVFFNNDCMDLLRYEFGEELTHKLMDIYQRLLEQNQKEYENTQQQQLSEMLTEEAEGTNENVANQTK